MSTGARKRIRSPRVAPLDLPPGRFALALTRLRQGDVLARLGIALVAIIAIWGLVLAWESPFSFREGYVPPRDITARVKFFQPNPVALEREQNRAANQEPEVYEQNPKELELLRASLEHAISEVIQAKTLPDLHPDTWKQFQPPLAKDALPPTPDLEKQEADFQAFRMALGADPGMVSFKQKLAKAFEPFEKSGLLDKLPDDHGEGNRKQITYYPVGRPHEKYRVDLSEVLIGNGEIIQKRLKESFPEVADRLSYWLIPRLRETHTLTRNDQATQQARQIARAGVEPQYTSYEQHQAIVPEGKPLDTAALQLLHLEHLAWLQQLGFAQRISRSAAIFGLLLAVFVLCGYYAYRRQRKLIDDIYRLATLLASAVMAVALVQWTSGDPWRAELIPLLLFGLTFAIAYHRDVALVLSIGLAIVLVTASGHGLGEFMVMLGVVATSIVQVGSIRSRSKLIKVGAIAGAVAFLSTIGVGVLDEQPLSWDGPLMKYASRNALWTLAAGFLLTGLLPMIEKLFGVLTEISLLEWGDVSHPLMQELVRRAPGTYNHSINVASIAEAAAESIGANGLLVRVGAYFHDIGKMLKPGYFAENQVPGANRHDTLVPAMSTLIIIAHIKDGADLGRQHDLPQPIIDFIEQHHGTTLVEYFFNRANEQSEANPDASEVHESAFRYPGPKPQTLEAAVLMLADACESAARTIVEPNPSRLESLVEELALKKLLDGQFDECGLTLEQLRTIEDSLIKSLTAVYHGRVKYPSQQTA
jgi:putative nucleotidyltransferase with HDIG domain